MSKIIKLRNIDDTFRIYLAKFSKLKFPLSNTEIYKKIKVPKSSFTEKYYPRAKFIGLIYKLNKNKKNESLIFQQYDKKWEKMIRNYYLLTPNCAKWIVFLRKIIKKYKFLINTRDLNLKIKNLIPHLQRLEVLHKPLERMNFKEAKELCEEGAKKDPLIKKYVLPALKLKQIRGRKIRNNLRLYPNKENNAILFSEFILREISGFPLEKEPFELRKKVGKKLEQLYLTLSNSLTFENIFDFELSKQKYIKANYLTFS